MPIGVHTSIAGGLHRSIERAASLGCDAMQIFGRNPRSWAFKPVSAEDARLFKSKRKDAGLWPVAVHTTYLINLCSHDAGIYGKSVDLFKKELMTAEAIGADYLVTHPGSPRDMGSGFALKRILEALEDVKKSGLGEKAMVLIENTAGGGCGFGSRLADIGDIIENAAGFGLNAGLCFDTCHAFAAGYPMGTPPEVGVLMKTIEKKVGIERLKLIHLNDSKGAMNSHIDRHEHIGKGRIGIDAMRDFLNRPEVARVPLILETPKKTENDDPRNLAVVREIRKARAR